METITLEQSIGRLIKHHREAAGLTLQDVAEEVGVTRSYISQIENGKKSLSIKRLYEMAFALNITVKELLP